MEHVEVIDAHGRVIAQGFVCDLCLGLSPRLDVFDCGLDVRGVHACHACMGELDEVIGGRARVFPEPEDLEVSEAC